jgi:hypothetical protein
MEMIIEKKEEESKYGKYSEGEIECAVNTLVEAEEIKKDSEMMKYVAECMQEKADAFKGVISSLDEIDKIMETPEDERKSGDKPAVDKEPENKKDTEVGQEAYSE